MAWCTSNRRRRLPADWPQRAARVLRRDGHRCQLRWPGCIGTATEVDHRTPGDDHREINLQAVCTPCHRKKSSREGNAAQARRRALRFRPPERHPGIRPKKHE